MGISCISSIFGNIKNAVAMATTNELTPIVTYEQVNGKKLKGAALDKEIKRKFKVLWKYDNDLMLGELISYLAKYFEVTEKQVKSLVEELSKA